MSNEINTAFEKSSKNLSIISAMTWGSVRAEKVFESLSTLLRDILNYFDHDSIEE